MIVKVRKTVHISQILEPSVIEEVQLKFRVANMSYSPTYGKTLTGYTQFVSPSGEFRTGLIDLMKSRLTAMGHEMMIVEDVQPNLEFLNYDLSAIPNLELRPYVEPAIQALADNLRGIWFCATNTGKTFMALAAMRHFGLDALFLVPPQRSDLVDQCYRDALHLGFDDRELSRVKASRLTKTKFVIASTATIASRLDDPYTLEWLKRFKFVIYDECQELPPQAIEVLEKINAPMRLFMSGTPFKHKHHDMTLMGLSGKILYKVTNEFLINNGYSAEPHIVYFPMKCHAKHEREESYSSVYKETIVENSARNATIANMARILVKMGEKVIITIGWKDHARILVRALRDNHLSAEVYTGEINPHDRKRQLRDFRSGETDVLVANQVLDVGISIPDITVLIAAGCGKTPHTNLQRVGRGLRRKNNRNVFFMIDIQDDVMFLKGQSSARKEIWRKQRGFNYHEVATIEELVKTIRQVSESKE